MVERLHRQLKAAIRCHERSSWIDTLPIVLFGLRTAWKDDLKSTAADIVFGEHLRLPGEFLVPSTYKSLSPQDIANRLRMQFANLAPVPGSRHSQRKVFVFKELATCSHFLIRLYA